MVHKLGTESYLSSTIHHGQKSRIKKLNPGTCRRVLGHVLSQMLTMSMRRASDVSTGAVELRPTALVMYCVPRRRV